MPNPDIYESNLPDDYSQRIYAAVISQSSAVPAVGDAYNARNALIDAVALNIAKAQDGDYWGDEISAWETSEVWEREAHPENYPSDAYEDREWYRRAANAALEAVVGVETSVGIPWVSTQPSDPSTKES